MNGRRIILTMAAALALVAGGTAAGAAIASGPVDSSGVVHGCYTTNAIKGSHSFVLQDAGTSCPRGTTAVMWNQQGPQGPKGSPGPQGVAGPQGPAGTQGPPGPDTSYTVAQGTTSTAGIGSFETAILTCPPSYPLMISGGYEIENSLASPTDYAVIFDQPANANSWIVRIAVPSGASANVSWHVQGVCAKQ